MSDQLAQFGAPQEVIDEAVEAELAANVCDVHEDNVIAVNAFCALSTQWRFAGMGGRTGIEYGSIPVVLDEMRILKRHRPALISDIRVMEIAALRVINRKNYDDDV